MPRGKKSAVGDTRTAPNGYHYTKTSTGWIGTGRLVASTKLGRPLLDTERIRYLDGNPQNLTSSNIEVFTVAEQTNAKRLAVLYAKRDEIEAKIEELEAEG